jgi:hypothetical protein
MEESIFDLFESNLTNPLTLHWSSSCEKVAVKDFVYAGELITIEKHTGTQIVALYILTRSSLIWSIDVKYKNPVRAMSILHLRNPRLLKIERPSITLYYINYE